MLILGVFSGERMTFVAEVSLPYWQQTYVILCCGTGSIVYRNSISSVETNILLSRSNIIIKYDIFLNKTEGIGN